MIGNIGIGHTRWATHGKISMENAHPHLSCDGKIAVAHNGIIENYQELRDELMAHGHKFISDTDTEIIPHYLEKHANLLAIGRLNSRIRGSYAYVLLSSDNGIWGTRKGISLFVGVNDGEYYIGSDCVAFPDCKEIVSLNDGDIVHINQSGIKYYDKNLEPKIKLPVTVGLLDNHYHDDNRHYMIEEIEQQPKVLSETIEQNRNNFDSIADLVSVASQVIITACGSSRYASLIGRYMLSKVGKRFCDVIMASEFKYFDDAVGRDTVVLAVSQSGETADVIDGVKRAKDKGAKIISILNRQNSILGDMSDHTVYLNCGNEISVAATKSFVCQLAIFYMLTHRMIGQLETACQKLKQLTEMIDTEIHNNGVHELAHILNRKNDVYYIARGINFAIASEGALKLKEVSYVHAEGLPAGELKHGTLSLFEKGTPLVAICPDDYTYDDTMNNIMEAKTRGAYIIGVSDRYNDAYDYWLKIGKVDELLYPIVEIIPLQLLAYYVAIERGCNPDLPRNLAKSVTVR
jgi:glucosamine--fructose-6-phosphate aminotransferase (isomerizing)